ncbi:MAG: hypothetical protein RL033_6847, partial [Pseudomonadota bacterium]
MDTEGLSAFLDESDELLQAVSSALVALEHRQDPETIGLILRGIHDIKGNAPFFGLTHVKRLAHQLEELVIAVRAGRLRAGSDQVSALLSGVDLLGQMLQRVRAGSVELREEDAATLQLVLARLERAGVPGSGASWARVWRELEQLARAPSPERCAQGVAALCQALAAVAATAEAPPPPLLAALAVPDVLSELEALLTPSFEDQLPAELAVRVGTLLAAGTAVASGAEAQVLREATAEYRAMMEAVGFVPLLRETLLERLIEARGQRRGETSSWAAAAPAELLELELAPGAVPSEQVASIPPAPPLPSPDTARGPRTMRVDERKIDEFLDYVGELIITREVL